MDDALPSWDLYRTLLAALQTGSLSGAARQLGLTQPTVGRQIDALESQLGISLFTRGRSGLTPTEGALALVPHARAMQAAAAAMARTASGEMEQVAGTVRITASEVMGCEVLPSILTEFRHAYPAVVVEVLTSDRISNLLTREADIAVRMVEPEQGDLITHHVGDVSVRLYAHEDYVARYGFPESAEALSQHAVIGFDSDASALVAANTRRLGFDRSLFSFRSDNPIAQHQALRAGFGIGAMQVPLAARNPELLPVLAGENIMQLSVWLAMHRELRGVRRVHLLYRHLRDALTRYCDGELV